ncbi:hypothetical protein [Natranaerofaba carboxydovora]|uniref:hypothetical protein n=1 Tax=Natranaerofaba carboxydovora TaxID=2742683 RepID=UPI001F132BA3|nr:hypothetical protein [Natranaerofaba carboxydovora]UMZ72544.1 hypothetical protein ACONDI_00065 [Natranaerofaba carboxydovora]
MYNLQNFFNYLLSSNIEADLQLKYEYPNFKKIIKEYQAVLKNHRKETPKLGKQVYSLPFELYGNDSYVIGINIDLLNQLIYRDTKTINKNDEDYKKAFKAKLSNIEEDLINIEFDKEFLKRIMDESKIDKTYAMKCVNKEDPVICGDFTLLNPSGLPFFIIDGNHKAYGKVQSGKDKIKGILISRNVWIKALVTNKDKLFIKIFNNINILLSYRIGYIPYNSTSKYMYDIIN